MTDISMEANDCLFHYTNVESLALILKNRTIRFNSLDKLDDLQEKETADIKNIGQFCYISSWTEDETESIPMWNMYASLQRGVRIKLHKNPFKVYDTLASDLSKFINAPVKDETNGKPFQSIIPLSELFSKDYYIIQAISKKLLFKVEYTHDQDKLLPHLLCEKGTEFSIAFGELGKFKNLHWSFQKEWRYILTVLPFNLKEAINPIQNNILNIANKMRLGLEKQPFPYYDMVISDDFFENMEITLSPRISAGNCTIVKNLIKEYNPTAVINKSSLTGLI